MARAVLVFLLFPKTGAGLGRQLGAVCALHHRMGGSGAWWGCAGFTTCTFCLQVGQRPSTTPARGGALLASMMQLTWTIRGTPSPSWVLSWWGTGGGDHGGGQGWSPPSHCPHPIAGGITGDGHTGAGEPRYLLAVPISAACGVWGSPQHWGQPLMPPLCLQVSPRLTSWSSSPSLLPSCIWATSRSEGGTATGTGASWRWARARCAWPHRDLHPGGAGDTSVPLQPADEALRQFCKLLGIEEAQVTRWLCHRKLVTAGETYLKPLSRQQALDSRDALAKHMYGQVFRWMVSRVNRALRSPEGHHTSIGILDIYG